MATPQKLHPRTLRSPTEEGFPEQSGRSSSGLAAQNAAAALEEAQRNAFRSSRPNSPDASTKLLPRNSRSAPNLQKMRAPPVSTSPPKRTSYLPTISSPLNPNSPPDSLKSRNSDEAAPFVEAPEKPFASSSNLEAGTWPLANAAAMKSISTPQLPVTQPPKSTIPKAPSMSQLLSPDASQNRPRTPLTPLSVQDLGSDYSRYFNPFGDSRRSSFVDLPGSGTQTPLPRYNSSHSRLSANTFEPVMEKSARTSLDSDNGEKERTALLEQERKALLSSPFIDDRMGFSPYISEKGRPYAFPMLVSEAEDDDDMHMPMPDDNVRFKPKLRDHFTRDNLCSTVGMFLMILGLLFVFIVMPVLFYTGVASFNYAYETPLDQFPRFAKPEEWARVNDLKYPFLKNIRSTLIDKDTPKSAYTATSDDGGDLKLVFSDEFNDNNRTFYEGDDPYWFAPDIWYGATQDLDWYDPDAVTTWNGTLELRLDAFNNHNLNFRSGMLNSWNQLCFKGGRFEVGVSLPGPAGIKGLWPGVWTMGNLGRPGYLSTTDGMWPYTYNDCDVGITPNQSSPDGISHLPGQRLSSCTCDGEDHPTPGTGRGAPEIDILEASASYQVDNLGVITQSYQVAPFDVWYYPDYDYMSFPNQSISYTNTYTGGPFQQAVSGTTTLNDDWYDGNVYQKYAFEYSPGTGSDGRISWFVGDDTMFTLDGRAIRKNGNVGDRIISEEPMSMILNLGLSNSWVAIDWNNLKFPTIMRVDYVRLYQKDGEEMVTCDPPGYETTEYIANHMDAYTNPNFTHWDQTGYSWPKHKLNSNC